jgi:hypothetical protein
MQLTLPTLTEQPINVGGSPETSPLFVFEPFNVLPAECPSNHFLSRSSPDKRYACCIMKLESKNTSFARHTHTFLKRREERLSS